MSQLEMFELEKKGQNMSLRIPTYVLIAAVLISPALIGLAALKMALEFHYSCVIREDHSLAGIHSLSIKGNNDEKPGTTLSGSITPLW